MGYLKKWTKKLNKTILPDKVEEYIEKTFLPDSLVENKPAAVAQVNPIATLTTGSEGVRSGMLMRQTKKKGAAYLAATAGQRAKNQTLGGMKQTLG